MQRLMIAVAVMLWVGGVSILIAEATPLGSGIPRPENDPSLVEKMGCGGPGRCPYGLRSICSPYGCTCVPCGSVKRPHPYYGGYRYRYRY